MNFLSTKQVEVEDEEKVGTMKVLRSPHEKNSRREERGKRKNRDIFESAKDVRIDDELSECSL